MLLYFSRDLVNPYVMGHAKQKERERKRSAASCQQLDKLLAKKSKRVNEEIFEIDDSEDDASDDDLTSSTHASLPSGKMVSYSEYFVILQLDANNYVGSNLSEL